MTVSSNGKSNGKPATAPREADHHSPVTAPREAASEAIPPAIEAAVWDDSEDITISNFFIPPPACSGPTEEWEPAYKRKKHREQAFRRLQAKSNNNGKTSGAKTNGDNAAKPKTSTPTKTSATPTPQQRASAVPAVLASADIRAAARNLDKQELRFLVDTYYQWQDYRKTAASQERALHEAGKPHAVISWQHTQMRRLEAEIKATLDAYTQHTPISQWARLQPGIGPVLAAGLEAHIDMAECPTAGHIWQFAGLNPAQQWLSAEKCRALVKANFERIESGEIEIGDAIEAIADTTGRNPARIWAEVERLRDEAGGMETAKQRKAIAAALAKYISKRPWNAKLKTLCWLIGECIVKNQNRAGSFYGALYQRRRAYETKKNERGDYAEIAAADLNKVGKNTASYKYYAAGQLPPGRIYARAKRYTVKIFLSHWHHMAYIFEYEKLPPKPFLIEHGGHSHVIEPPNSGEFPLAREVAATRVNGGNGKNGKGR